jgi:hypothetical protein
MALLAMRNFTFVESYLKEWQKKILIIIII